LTLAAIGSHAQTAKFESIVDGEIYIKLADSDNNAATDPMAGTITYNGTDYTATDVSGKSGRGVADGKYYVIDAGENPFETSTSISLTDLDVQAVRLFLRQHRSHGAGRGAGDGRCQHGACAGHAQPHCQSGQQRLHADYA
jgi:hypothetical protein